MTDRDRDRYALVVVDAQQRFGDPRWGPRDNRACDDNIAALVRHWSEHGRPLVYCGITTNHCCETTARVGGNLGHDVLFALDATHTFDRPHPDGGTIAAAEVARVTVTNLHGEFATVVSTADLLAP